MFLKDGRNSFPWFPYVFNEEDERCVAKFPCSLAMTVETPFKDSVIGPQLKEMFYDLEISAAVILAVYIMLQKMLKEQSEWREWIDMLPKRIETPLMYSEDQMQELNKTALSRAVRQMKTDMKQNWEALQTPLQEILHMLSKKSL